MTLETMRPTPTWDATAHGETVETLSGLADEITVKVWGADWCGDCRSQLPEFAAALDAAGIADERIEQFPVEKRDDGSKTGRKVEAYGIEYIPTVVIERGDEELARFVEEEPVPIAVYLADRIEEREAAVRNS